MNNYLRFTLLSVLIIVESIQASENLNLFTSDRSSKALSHPYDGLSDDLLDQFVLGRSFFTIPWVESPTATTARDGLGPLFNANSCKSCHQNNGGGESSTDKSGSSSDSVDRSIILKLVQKRREVPQIKNQQSGFKPDPVYGSQLAINGNHDVPYEGRVKVTIESIPFEYPDGDKVVLRKPTFIITDLNYGALSDDTSINPRRALSLIGMGLIDRIPADQILKREDEHDQNGDGISGKINTVWSVQDKKLKLGRYGWKATTASLLEQTANALINDMGLTSPWYSMENCTPTQTACTTAYTSPTNDVPMQRLMAISEYISNLKVPLRKKSQGKQGEKLFYQVGCHQCHQTSYVSDTGVDIDPYSDFLLHDMGVGLADNSRMFKADPEEWRTPPLWGIGISKRLNSKAGYLHDGRATTLEQAVLWHAGEALKVKDKFIHLNKNERAVLLSFLENM